jgi:hypothetical protein
MAFETPTTFSYLDFRADISSGSSSQRSESEPRRRREGEDSRGRTLQGACAASPLFMSSCAGVADPHASHGGQCSSGCCDDFFLWKRANRSDSPPVKLLRPAPTRLASVSQSKGPLLEGPGGQRETPVDLWVDGRSLVGVPCLAPGWTLVLPDSLMWSLIHLETLVVILCWGGTHTLT